MAEIVHVTEVEAAGGHGLRLCFDRLAERGGHRLERLRVEAEYLPSVNQIELHPWLQQAELRAWHVEHAIATEAWSPLAQGALLEEPAITEISAANGKTSAQVILRWHLQLGNVVIPKSATPVRIQENIDEMATIAGLDRGQRTGADPSTFAA